MPKPTSDHDLAEAIEADPTLLDPAGPAVRPTSKGRLSGAIPVRFSDDTIRRVKDLAEADGVTVSSWIRDAVDDAVARRTVSRVVVSERSVCPDPAPRFTEFHLAVARRG